LLGLVFVAPWQIQELDEEWLAVLDSLCVVESDRANLQKAKDDFERTLAQVRAETGYRSYLRKH